jgi:ABC-type transport system substrate-binding protein
VRRTRAIAAGSWIAAALLLPFSAAAPMAAAGPVRLTIGVIGPIGSLDPATATSAVAREVWQLQYPTLTTFAPSPLDVVPGLADSWTATADGRGFVYTLRPATWSDGQPVTAADVVSSLDRARDGHWPYAAGMVENLTATAVGATTVQITSSGAHSALPVLPLNVFPAAAPVGNAEAAGSGDWRVVDRRDHELRMAVVDRPGRPPLDEIVFRSYPDAKALEDALAASAVDVAAGFAPSDYTRVQAISGASAIHANDGDQWMMQLRVDEPVLRRAIARAVDRDALLQTVAKGVGRAQTIPVVARAAEWQLPDAEADSIASDLAYDPGAARAAVATLATPAALTIAAPNNAEGRAITREVTHSLDAVGITVTPATGDTPADLTIVRRDPTDDPTDVLKQYTCAGGIWCDAEYDSAFARYASAPDIDGRRDAARAMVQRLADQSAEVVLFAPDQLQSFTTRNVTGLLQEPSDPRLVVFWPSVQQYRNVKPTPAPASEELPNRTFAALAITGAVVVGLGVVVIDRRIQARR